ncbi:MAG: hypothetical protein WCL39_04790 [Armatimonadota bacterium]
MGKLTKLHVTIIGVVLCLVVGLGMFFLLIKPANEQLADLQTQYEARKAIADQLPQAKVELVKARQAQLQAQLDYRKIEDAKMPVVSFTDRAQGMIAMWREQAEVLGPMLENWPRRFGVDLMNSISIPAASTNPNSFADGLTKIGIGSISVRGDLPSILRHIEGWNKFGRLVQIDPVSITGVSPSLSASYNVTVLLFPRGNFGQPLAIAGDTGQAGAGGGVAPLGGLPSTPADMMMPPPGSPRGGPSSGGMPPAP